jgi:regulator of protease activity HflC (stomatin/prohibitin superfamily)
MLIINFIAVLLTLYGIIGLLLAIINRRGFSGPDANNVITQRVQRISLPLRVPALLVGALTLFLSSIVVRVDAQDVGVLVTPRGVSADELHTGWHLLLPWNAMHTMDKTVWVYTCSHNVNEGQKADADAIWAPTKDGIKMGFDVSVSWRIMPEEASWIYSNVTENEGGDKGRYIWLEENVIRAKLKSALALTVSNYTPIEVYSVKREEIQNHIVKRMREEMLQYRLVVEQLDLREVFYNPEYEQSINAKKLAEQEVLRLFEVTKQKEEQLKQSEIDKNIAIQMAEGEAKALQIKGSSIAQNPKIIQLEWINKWNGELPTYMMGDGQGVILNLPKSE